MLITTLPSEPAVFAIHPQNAAATEAPDECSRSTPFKYSPTTTLIIAVFAEQPHAIANLHFFLRQGVLVNDPRFAFVVVVNGNASSEVIGLLKSVERAACNFEVRWRENNGFDSCAWREALVSNKAGLGIQPPLSMPASNATFVITINFSLRGPFLRPDEFRPWPEAFTSLLLGPTNVRLSGTTMNCDPLLHIQGMLWAFLGSDIPWLLEEGFPCFPRQGSLDTQKERAIVRNELSVPVAVLRRGYNLAVTQVIGPQSPQPSVA